MKLYIIMLQLMFLSSVFITISHTNSYRFRCSFITDAGEGFKILVVVFQTS